MTLKELLQKRAGVVQSMKDIVAAAEKEDRDLTAEEQKSFGDLKDEKTKLDSRIERAETVEDAEAASEDRQPAVSRRGRSAAIEHPAGPEAKKEFETFGEFMHAVRFKPNDQRLNFVEGVGAEAVGMDMQAEMRMDNDTQGGFMVPRQHLSIFKKIEPQDAIVRPRANVIPAGSPPDAGVTFPALDQTGAAPDGVYGGVKVGWIGEGEEKPETDAKLREVSLTPKEVAGYTTITDKLLRNWQASGAFIEQLLRGAVLAAEDYAFSRGDGVARPLGVLNATATYFVNRLVANQIAYKDLVAMVARVLMRGGSPVWSMPQGALPQIATLKDDLGNFIWVPNAQNGLQGTLLGYPVIWNNRQPALGTKGDVILADWSMYLIKDGSGPFVAASEHVKFTSNKTVIKIFWNVDGAPWLTAPFQEENGYQVSPFVALDVPAG